MKKLSVLVLAMLAIAASFLVLVTFEPQPAQAAPPSSGTKMIGSGSYTVAVPGNSYSTVDLLGGAQDVSQFEKVRVVVTNTSSETEAKVTVSGGITVNGVPKFGVLHEEKLGYGHGFNQLLEVPGTTLKITATPPNNLVSWTGGDLDTLLYGR